MALLWILLLYSFLIKLVSALPFSADVYIPFEVFDETNSTGGNVEGWMWTGDRNHDNGILGRALYLDGNSTMRLGVHPETCFFNMIEDFCPDGFTLSFWVKFQNTTSNGQPRIVFDNGGCSQAQEGVCIFEMAGALVVIQGTRMAYERLIYVVMFPIAYGEWRHLAVTFQPGVSLHLYLDGLEVAMSNVTLNDGLHPYVPAEVVLGGSSNATDNYDIKPIATVDELLFWEEFKNDTFITEVFNSFLNAINPDYSAVPVTTIQDGFNTTRRSRVTDGVFLSVTRVCDTMRCRLLCINTQFCLHANFRNGRICEMSNVVNLDGSQEANSDYYLFSKRINSDVYIPSP